VTDFLIKLDQSLFIYLHQKNFTFLNDFMTFMSSKSIWIPLLIPLMFFAWKREYKKHFIFFLLFLSMTLALSDITSSYLLKNVFNRLRPCRDIELASFIIKFGQRCGGKFGFVSSHASNSLALIIYFARTLQLKNLWFLIYIFPLVIGYSRIYLGVHYPGDVLGGFLVGLLWSCFFSWAYRIIKEQDETYSSVRH
jgi:undecaprenyl-diphosphatase